MLVHIAYARFMLTSKDPTIASTAQSNTLAKTMMKILSVPTSFYKHGGSCSFCGGDYRD